MADPRRLLAAANDWQVTQAFASPAVWRTLSAHCERTGERIESLRQVFSCGAPVPAAVLCTMLDYVAPNAQMHTPYGATECLPVATIEAKEVLYETAAKTGEGAGICVGRPFGTIDWKVIRITDDPIASMNDAEELPAGEIGELIVRGPQASLRYVTRTECNAESKIADCGTPREPGIADSIQSEIRNPKSTIAWHRMGDVGYLDDQGRFWYCGRKSQRVETKHGTLFTECVEAAFNRHPDVQQSALVGIGVQGDQFPVVCICFKPTVRTTRFSGRVAFRDFDVLARQVIPSAILVDWLDYDEFPVDVRHNAKIQREQLGTFTADGILLADGMLAKANAFPEDLVLRAKAHAKR
jgi:acyl-CoA synthetase (AMP-forming)/AMP-acid ligase II